MWLATNSGPFELTELSVKSPRLAGKSILHISDLHFAPGQKNKANFIKELAGLNPDLVVNTGDNLGHKNSIGAAIEALRPLSKFPGVFVNGSNDYREPKPRNPFTYLVNPSKVSSERNLDTKRFTAELEGFAWLNLNNSHGKLAINGLRLGFIGVDDPHENLDDLDLVPKHREVLGELDVLLGVAHAPYRRVIDAFSEVGADLMFAGHTHGGQICLPGKRALVTNCDLETQYASGLSAWGESLMLHVSQGMGQSIYAPIRLFCPPGATLLRFS